MKKYSFTLLALACVFCTCLIVANIIAGKLWATPIIGITLTCGVFVFPIVYIIGDVVPEVYGYPTARKVIMLGFVANLIAVLFFLLTISAPFPGFWNGQEAFKTVLGFTPRLLLASFCGYLVGTNANAWVLVQLKRITKAKYLWIRTITSTIVGEGLDSIIFMTLAFYGVVPTPLLPGMILAQTAFKTLYEILATPITYLVIGYVKRLEGIDRLQVQPVE